MHLPGQFRTGFGSRGDVFGFGRMDLMSGPYGPPALAKAIAAIATIALAHSREQFTKLSLLCLDVLSGA